MCCCAKPNVNGEPGYSWDGKQVGVHPVNPPTLQEGDRLLFDEPGRCGGMDSHCHHYRIVGERTLLVKHGGGEERIRLSLPGGKFPFRGFETMDSNMRYWLLNAIYHAYVDGRSAGHDATAREYREALVDGRLRKRKLPTRGVKVWIEPREAVFHLGAKA